jgi:hypothetical protein
MAVGVGVLSGLFFGSWAGFVAKTHLFEELDRNVDPRGGSSGADGARQLRPLLERIAELPDDARHRAIISLTRRKSGSVPGRAGRD